MLVAKEGSAGCSLLMWRESRIDSLRRAANAPKPALAPITTFEHEGELVLLGRNKKFVGGKETIKSLAKAGMQKPVVGQFEIRKFTRACSGVCAQR